MPYLRDVTRALSAVALVLLGAVVGCASDPDPLAPEASVVTPGAFFAVVDAQADEEGLLGLFRTLSALEIELDTVLFCSTYDVAPASFEEARELAKRHDLPVALELKFVSHSSVVSSEHAVVWYRSLNDEELARVP